MLSRNMFQRFSSLTLLCCINLIWSNPDCCTQNCYKKVYIVNKGPTLWFEANILCRQVGMELATIESREEQEFLEIELNYVPDQRKGIANGYWTSGVRRKSEPDQFVWFSNGQPLVYSKFAKSQPDNHQRNEACVEVFINQPNVILWNDFKCDHKIGYICQEYVRNLTCESISKSTYCEREKLKVSPTRLEET